MQDSLITTVKKEIEQKKLLERGDKILIACSGGADSIVLTEILRVLATAYSWQIYVCHVNHHIRGKEAEEDALWVAQFCRMRGLKFILQEVDVPKLVAEKGYSLEEAARILRYQVLNKVVKEHNLSKIVVAHNLEDNAETILMNILRGSGIEGLTGIKQKSSCLVRPFLNVPRQEILRFAAVQKIAFRFDSTNNDKRYLRNKIRLELLPSLEKYNPEITTSLVRMGKILARDASYLHNKAQEIYLNALERQENILKLGLRQIKELEKAILSRVLVFAVKTILTEKEAYYLNNKHVESLIALVKEGKTGAIIELPASLKVKKDYGALVFSLDSFIQNKEQDELGDYDLPVPGRLILPDGRILRASFFRGSRPRVDGKKAASFSASVVQGSLKVRGRLPGDVFQPSGMQGQSKKLKDFLIDEKISAEKRDSIPLVFDAAGLLWVAGVRPAFREVKLEESKWLYLEMLEKEYLNV